MPRAAEASGPSFGFSRRLLQRLLADEVVVRRNLRLTRTAPQRHARWYAQFFGPGLSTMTRPGADIPTNRGQGSNDHGRHQPDFAGREVTRTLRLTTASLVTAGRV